MGYRAIRTLVLSLVVTFAVVSLILWINHFSPGLVFWTLIKSAWGSSAGILSVLTKMSLLILTGLAVAIPYRAGLFNIGGEGQFYLGALAAALIGSRPWGNAGPLHLLLCLLAGTLCGCAWGGIAGWLKTQRGIHEVIATIMLNFIAFQLVNELTFNVFGAGSGSGRTALIAPTAIMPTLWSQGATETSWGIVVACLPAILFSLGLVRTQFGFHLRAVGANPQASRYSGIPVESVHLQAMILGGGCAGLAGALETTGVTHTFYARFVGGYGFDGIAVAFLGFCEPWGTIPAALGIATLRASDRSLQLDLGVPKEMVFMLEGILIICMSIFTRKWKHES